MPPKENIQVTLGQLVHAAYIFADPFYGLLRAVKTMFSLTSITWPIEGLSVELTEVTCFLLTADLFLEVQQIIRTSQKLGASLLGLDKSIYYLSEKWESKSAAHFVNCPNIQPSRFIQFHTVWSQFLFSLPLSLSLISIQLNRTARTQRVEQILRIRWKSKINRA